jgi:hypothetical protein
MGIFILFLRAWQILAATTPVGEPAAAKPPQRTVEARSGDLVFMVTHRPGVPEPGESVDVRIELVEKPAVPDPVYGETIPVKDLSFLAQVHSETGPATFYRVHALQDAGGYGFHFTPFGRAILTVAFDGTYKGVKFHSGIQIPVGIWPLPGMEKKEQENETAGHSEAGRRPALPNTETRPAMPEPKVGQGFPATKGHGDVRSGMEALGWQWARLGELLLVKKPDPKEMRKVASEMNALIAKEIHKLPEGDEFTRLLHELHTMVSDLEKVAGEGREKQAGETFRRMGSQSCNRCHMKERWHLDDWSTVP